MSVIEIGDPDDERLGDYLDLRDPGVRRRRERNEFFIAEGLVAIGRLLVSGHRVRSILVSDKKVSRIDELGGPETLAEVPIYMAPQSVMETVAGYNVHRGVLAAADRRPLPTLDDVLATSRRIAVLEGLNDPENLGAIARSARGLGIDALVIDPTCTDPYYRRTVRVSMGEILFLPVARGTDWTADLQRIVDAGFELWALTPSEDADDIWRFPVPKRVALLLGAEGPGLSPSSLATATRRVRIPLATTPAVTRAHTRADPSAPAAETVQPSPSTAIDRQRIDSLNVSHAAAIAFAVVNRPARN